VRPIFDIRISHVGWYKDGHIFDPEVNWLAFVHQGHIFSAVTLEWLGPWNDGSLLDQQGQVVAWLDGGQPRGSEPPLPPPRAPRPPRPFRHVRPIHPRRPLFPQQPASGWSMLAWHEWLGLTLDNDDGEVDQDEAAGTAPPA